MLLFSVDLLFSAGGAVRRCGRSGRRRRPRVVLTALRERGADAAADELERYLTASERTVLGAFARMGKG